MNPDNMHILMIDSTTGNDYCPNLCSKLARTCGSVTLVTVRDRELDDASGYRVLPLAPSKDFSVSRISKTFSYAGYLTRLIGYIFSTRPDIVHFQFLRRERMESLLMALLRLTGTKTVHTAHNVLPHEKSIGDKIFKDILYRSSNLIIAHSRYTRDMLSREFGVPKEKCRIIPHGNYDSCLPRQIMTRDEARMRLCLTQDDEVLLFFGYIRQYKGIDLLVDAFAQACATRPAMKLIIAGTAQSMEDERWCRSLVAGSGVSDRIRLVPEYIPNRKLPTYFSASDIVVLPYRNIYHSGVVHMAYTFGRPVISTNVGDFSETVLDGKTGYVLKQNDKENLAAAIDKAFSDRGKMEMMGLEASAISTAMYSWVKIADSTMHAYSDIPERKASRHVLNQRAAYGVKLR